MSTIHPEEAIIKFFSFLEERKLVKEYLNHLYNVPSDVSYIETLCRQDYPEGLLDEILRRDACFILPEDVPKWRALSDEWKALLQMEDSPHE